MKPRPPAKPATHSKPPSAPRRGGADPADGGPDRRGIRGGSRRSAHRGGRTRVASAPVAASAVEVVAARADVVRDQRAATRPLRVRARACRVPALEMVPRSLPNRFRRPNRCRRPEPCRPASRLSSPTDTRPTGSAGGASARATPRRRPCPSTARAPLSPAWRACSCRTSPWCASGRRSRDRALRSPTASTPTPSTPGPIGERRRFCSGSASASCRRRSRGGPKGNSFSSPCSITCSRSARCARRSRAWPGRIGEAIPSFSSRDGGRSRTGEHRSRCSPLLSSVCPPNAVVQPYTCPCPCPSPCPCPARARARHPHQWSYPTAPPSRPRRACSLRSVREVEIESKDFRSERPIVATRSLRRPRRSPRHNRSRSHDRPRPPAPAPAKLLRRRGAREHRLRTARARDLRPAAPPGGRSDQPAVRVDARAALHARHRLGSGVRARRAQRHLALRADVDPRVRHQHRSVRAGSRQRARQRQARAVSHARAGPAVQPGDAPPARGPRRRRQRPTSVSPAGAGA